MHAEAGPSGADRWSVCTASIHHIRSLGEIPDQDTEWSAEGTFLHDIASECRELGIAPAVGFEREVAGYTFTLDAETAEQMQEGLDWLDEHKFRVELIEQRLDLSEVLAPGQFGTLDFGGLTDDGEVVVFDWKWGAGVPVSPVENRQLVIYAAGFVRRLQKEGRIDEDYERRVKLVIWQPRIADGGGVWETTVGGVLARADELRVKAREALEGPGEFVVTEKGCRFCPAARLDRCDAYAAAALETAQLDFDDLDEDPLPLPDPAKMTTERRAAVWRNRDVLKKWLREVEARLLGDVQEVGEVGGIKAVEGRQGDRVWVDEAEAAKAVETWLGRKNAYTTKLRSPAQVEKEIGPRRQKRLEALVTRAPGQPMLVDSSDKRPALAPIANDFDDLDEELI